MKSFKQFVCEKSTSSNVKQIKELVQKGISNLYKEKVLEFFIDDLSGNPTLTINYFSAKKSAPISARANSKNQTAILVEIIDDKKARTEMLTASFSGINAKKAKRMTSKQDNFKNIANHIINWFKQQKDNIWEE